MQNKSRCTALCVYEQLYTYMNMESKEKIKENENELKLLRRETK